MPVNLSILAAGTMNINASHGAALKASIVHQTQQIGGVTEKLVAKLLFS
ncbi:hypothetical protein [Yersinia sp. 2466 StPb PI]